MDEEYTKLRDHFSVLIEQHSMRKTPERFAVLDALHNIGEMVGIQELLTYITDSRFRISRSTLYNVLTLLCDWGIAIKLQVDPHNVLYGLAGSDKLSVRLKCDNCGRYIDTKSVLWDDFLRDCLEQYGFVVDNQKVLVHGLCNKCKKH